MNRLACFFHHHFLWSLGNSTLEGKPICVRVSLFVAICQIKDALVLSRPRSQRMTNQSCLGGKDDSCLCVVICGTENQDETTPKTRMKPPKNQDETTQELG